MKQSILGVMALCLMGGCAQDSAERAWSSQSRNENEIQCWPGPPMFPSFSRACATVADCSIGVYQITCCGTRRAVGINAGEQAAFDAAAAICGAQYPSCDCADFGFEAEESGEFSYEFEDIGVACLEQGCTTFVIPE